MTNTFAPARSRLLPVLFAMVLPLVAAAAKAHEYKLGQLTIVHPWSRATPPGAQTAAGYLTIRNDGSESDRLVAATVEIVGKVDLHQVRMENGVAQMRPLENGVEIPAGKTVELKPGSFHLMFMELEAPLKEGDSLPGTLTFERAGAVDVTFSVGPIGASGSGHDHGATGN